MEEAGVEELREVDNHAQVDERAHVVRLRLRELLALDPLGDVHPPRCVPGVVGRDDDHRHFGHLAADPLAILALDNVVKLGVETRAEFVKELDEIEPLAQRGKAAEEEAKFTRQVQVERDRLEHVRPLHLDGDDVARLAQRRAVDLAERCGRDGRGRDLGEDVGDLRDLELVADRAHRQLVVERGHLVAQLLQLHHRSRREDVGSNRERLSELNEERTKRDDRAAQVGGAADLDVLSVAYRQVEQHAEREPGALARDLQHTREHRARPLCKVALERVRLEEEGELIVGAG
mmetsp:Transcript_9617/g.30412  ORF Transcript_9617/g.30412 Transcript_9617/m.30412 type:complete len:290 (+) Transcript_9617:784-1653(+)